MDKVLARNINYRDCCNENKMCTKLLLCRIPHVALSLFFNLQRQRFIYVFQNEQYDKNVKKMASVTQWRHSEGAGTEAFPPFSILYLL